MNTAQDGIDAVVAALRATLYERGLALRSVSGKLRHHEGYLGRALRGEVELKLIDVFRLLELAGTHPARFFERCFPLSGLPDEQRRLLEQAASTGAEIAPVRLSARQRKPKEWVERAGRLLRSRIRSRGQTQQQISLALGLGASALGQALRGNSNLTVQHTLGVLACLRESPALYFAELTDPEEGPVLSGLSYGELLALAERLVRGAGAAVPSAAGKALSGKRRTTKRGGDKSSKRRR